jgi:DNA-directed RNA polymerase specialized sigma24 family protein
MRGFSRATPRESPCASPTGTGAAGGEADHAVTALYEEHYRSLVRLAALLVRDVATAEEIVEGSFVALPYAWRRPDGDRALRYLQHSVVSRSRSARWQRVRAGSGAPEAPVISALRALPTRQREALVLRYYADLPEAEIAAVMGVSIAAVKAHIAQASAALHAVLDHAQQRQETAPAWPPVP